MTHWTETVFGKRSELFADTLRRMDAVAEEEAEEVLQLATDEFGSKPSSVLDAGCGMGRHALEFAERGIDVDGIDISDAYLETARKRAKERGVSENVTFYRHDMRRADELDGTYDLIVNLFGSFGFYGRETDSRILAQFHELLSDDGGLVVELSNKAHELHNYEPDRIQETSDRFIVQRDEYDVEKDVLQRTYDVFCNDDFGYRGQMEFEYRLYSVPEMKSMCRRAGFDSISVEPKYEDELGLDAEILRYSIS